MSSQDRQPVDDARLAELQRLSDRTKNIGWRRCASDEEFVSTQRQLIDAVPDLLAELSRLRAEHNQQAQQIEAVREVCRHWVDEPWPQGRRPFTVIVFGGHVLAALVPVQHPTEEG